jgi:hypothetical protein
MPTRSAPVKAMADRLAGGGAVVAVVVPGSGGLVGVVCVVGVVGEAVDEEDTAATVNGSQELIAEAE